MSSETRPHAQPAEEVQQILAWLDEKPSLSRHVDAARRLDAVNQREPDLFTGIAALFVRNFTIEPIQPLLNVAAHRAGYHVEVAYSGYDPAADDGLPGLLADEPNVVLLALRLEELAPVLTSDFLGITDGTAAEVAEASVDQVVSLARRIRSGSRAPILVHNFVPPQSLAAGIADSQDPRGQLNLVRRMNVRLAESILDIDGAYIVDVDLILAQLGLQHAYDDRGGRMSDAPFSQAALRALAEAEVRHIQALRGPAVKCLVVDCDNTLWGGVVGEDGIAGLTLGETGAGRKYRDLQQSLLDLRRRGVVLAIASKNEADDVLEVLRTHPDCVLRETDFAAMRVNWDDKAENISSIADELNLSLEHMVFIDDNPVECEWVQSRLPRLRVVQWPPATGEAGSIRDLALFDSLVVTDEDRTRTEMYRSEGQRRAVREEMTSIDDYLRSLEMVAVVGTAGPEHLPRLAQLTQRTNQFNLTTRRYDIPALQEVLDDSKARLVWLELRDRFGANGMVGCGIIRRQDNTAVIDTLLLSCRVIGRGAEAILVHRLATLARDMGASDLIGEYVPSNRNAQVAELYGRLGFDGAPASGETRSWRWVLDNGLPSYPNWFKTVELVGGGE